MAYLYKEIMNVPGLSGSSYDRQKQYWNKLGLGGNYTGSLAQNMKLLSYLGKPSYGLSSSQKSGGDTQKSNKSLAEQYAAPGKKAAPNAPPFSKVLPFEKAISSLMPVFEEAAASQVNPEAIRQYQAAERELMNRLASTGGGRFARGQGQVGALQAQSERQRKSQLHNFLYGPSGYVTGFKKLWYEPAREAWTRAMTQGRNPAMPKVPGFEQYAQQYRQAYGKDLQRPTGQNPLASPLIPEAPGWPSNVTPLPRVMPGPRMELPEVRGPRYWTQPGSVLT